MSVGTGIEWTETTWNPTTGCDRVSPGCDECYALTLAARLKATGSAKYQNDGDPRTSGPGFGITTHPDTLDAPLRWRKPRKVFVNSMSDLFHPRVPDEFIAHVFAVMAMAPLHTFQILTKRAPRMRSLLNDHAFWVTVAEKGMHYALERVDGRYRSAGPIKLTPGSHCTGPQPTYCEAAQPLPNVWLVVSVEDQQHAELRIPVLLDTPAAVRGVSCEPLLGSVLLAGREWLRGSDADPEPDAECEECGTEEFSDLAPGHPTVHRCDDHEMCDLEGAAEGWCNHPLTPYPRLDWVIAGGESGAGARPMHPDWARSLRDQCLAAHVPFFFKQWGAHGPAREVSWGGVRDVTLAGEWVPHVADRADGAAPMGAVRKNERTQNWRLLDGRTWDEFPEVRS